MRAMFWTAIGLVNAGIVGFELGARRPPDFWFWAGLVVVIAWPLVVRVEYSEECSPK